MDGTYESMGYKHIGTLEPQDLYAKEMHIWKPNYPIGPAPDFGPKWTPTGKTVQRLVVDKFTCAGNCDEALGSSHKDYAEGPITKCSCFTDESNIDFYFDINTEHPRWKEVLKEIEKK